MGKTKKKGGRQQAPTPPAPLNPTDNTRPIFLAAALCFFLSGAAGLGYQVLWVRMLDKVIGSAPFAVATVVSVVMTGLALGSRLAGKNADRLLSRGALLALYGKLEVAIGLLALAVPLAIPLGRPLYQALYDRLLDHPWCYQMAIFVGCALLLLPPTACMGATLPVLCRFSIRSSSTIASTSAQLYGLNTLGAGLGSLLCGFFLIRHFGVSATLLLFAAVNILVGAACIGLSRLLPEESPVDNREDHPKQLPGGEKSGQIPWALAIFAVTGFCSMAYEVLWMRLLSLLAGPTAYSFTLVVATFILGLALGSLLFSRIADHIPRPFSWLLLTQTAAALSALAVSQLFGGCQFFFRQTDPSRPP